MLNIIMMDGVGVIPKEQLLQQTLVVNLVVQYMKRVSRVLRTNVQIPLLKTHTWQQRMQQIVQTIVLELVILYDMHLLLSNRGGVAWGRVFSILFSLRLAQ